VKQLALNIGDELLLKPGVAVTGVPAYQSIGGFISTVLPNVYVVAGIILFVLLLAGGIMFISSAGKGESESTKKGSQAIAAALIGFLIIFASYWIIQLVETITGLTIF
jgi:hypothetical protein